MQVDYGTFAAPSTAYLPHDDLSIARHIRRMASGIDMLIQRIGAKLFETGMSDREVSMAATGKPDAIRYITKRRAMPSAERLDAIARTLGTSSAWLLGQTDDQGPTDPEAASQPVDIGKAFKNLPRNLPIYGTALGADLDLLDTNGHPVAIEQTEINMAAPIDYIARPTALAGRSEWYVIIVAGHSMEPRFDHGRRLLANGKRPPRVSDDVVVQLRRPIDQSEEASAVLLKQLVKRKAQTIVLRQFNPAIEFEVPNEAVLAVHPIVPWDDVLDY